MESYKKCYKIPQKRKSGRLDKSFFKIIFEWPRAGRLRMKSAGHGAESIWGNHRFGLRRHRITEQGRFMAPVRRQPNCMDTGRIKIGFCLFGRKMKMHARVGGIEGPRNTISQTNLKDRPLPRVCPFFFAAGPQTASANKSVCFYLCVAKNIV